MPCSFGIPLWHFVWWKKVSRCGLQSWPGLASTFLCGLEGVQIYWYTLESTVESRLWSWPALEPTPRCLLPPNSMSKWNFEGASHWLVSSQHMVLVMKGVVVHLFLDLVAADPTYQTRGHHQFICHNLINESWINIFLFEYLSDWFTKWMVWEVWEALEETESPSLRTPWWCWA